MFELTGGAGSACAPGCIQEGSWWLYWGIIQKQRLKSSLLSQTSCTTLDTSPWALEPFTFYLLVFFPWFARFSSIAMVIDEVGFCKGIHNMIMRYVALWLSCYGTVHTSPFYSCAPACCKYPDSAMLRIWFVEHPVYTMFRLSQLSDNLWICQRDQGAATVASRKCKLWDELRQFKQLLLLSWVLEVVTSIFLLKTCWCLIVCFTEAFCCFPPGGTAG